MATFRCHAMGVFRRLAGQSRAFSLISASHGYNHPRPVGNSVFWRTVVPPQSCTRGFRVNMEPTPNPDSMKFIPEDQVVLPKELGTGMHFTDPKQAGNSRLVRQLLKLKYITSVFLGPDFISVNKQESGDWTVLRPLILSAIMDAFGEGKPIITAPAEPTSPASAQTRSPDGTEYSDADKEIISLIEELFETRIRPAVQEDGGDIFFVAWDSDRGVVKLRMAGSCVGCPSSSLTLKQGVESMLMHYIPEVNGIEQVEKDELVKINDEEVSVLEERLAAAGVPK